MPLQATSGAASYDAFGGSVPVVPTYIEDVMSTWLYTGNSSTQTITNGIDLSTKGGLVWIKQRASDRGHVLVDTVRGATKFLTTCNSAAVGNATDAEGTDTARVPSFTTSGFNLGADSATNSGSMVSWTFRKQPKFFTQGTFTGDGTTNKVITHDLGGTTGFIIVKRTDSTGNWQTWHRTFTAKQTIFLNTTDARQTYSGADDITVTNTSFTVGTNQIFGNASGATYVYYVFAHDAGGFGLTGTDNVISCGSFTTDSGGNATVNLGYEPQWILTKRSISPGGNWLLIDTMRGLSQTGTANLFPNTSGAETTTAPGSFKVTATGFDVTADAQVGGSDTWIYIAIRRGPMAVPTDGTKVYNATTGAAYSNPETVSVGFPPDLVGINNRGAATGHYFVDRLRGGPKYFTSTSTAAEADDGANKVTFDTQNSATVGGIFGAPYNGLFWFFRRAPSFFDEVCYTGTGSARTVSHNLGVAPELYIVKGRSSVTGWSVGSTSFTALQNLLLNSTAALDSSDQTWNSTYPTASVFSVGGSGQTNASAATYVAYLFATCAGVSKVGSYTGTATTKQIDCGFTAGARFVLIKRTDSAGDWYVWDTARGIVSGNDPYLLLNSTAAEVTSTDYIDTYSAGFEISSTAPAAINASGGTYIFLAIA